MGMHFMRVCVIGGWLTALLLHYLTSSFLSARSVAGGGGGTYLWAFHATVIPSNLIQTSSFSLVCFSHIGACRLQKPYVCVCVREGGREGREKGTEGDRQS